uniref:C2H2-type domain-containing protein n=1 Tax=Setaria digitata TaxID=48799 RepID=A0A915PMB2_9BILA
MIVWSWSHVTANDEPVDYPWDLNGACQPYIEKFAETSSKMIHCAMTYSSPPKICTYCTEQYVALKHIEYELHKLKHIFSRDNISCDRVIFENYLISYVEEISSTVTQKMWENSRCSSCVNITWNFETNATDYAYYNNTIVFQNKLYEWRRCVSNSSFVQNNRSAICDECLSSFNELFQFYWRIYVSPGVSFCLDVETTMNDTMNLWHNVWQCQDDQAEELRDWTLLGCSLTVLIIITVFFYAGSYIQSPEIQRHLVQYSSLEAPQGLRSRLLTSSTSGRLYTEQTTSA